MALGLRSTAQEILELNVDPSSGIFQRPRSVQHAHFTDALWVTMKAKKIESMPALNRGAALDTLTKDTDITFKFLAPNDIQEAIGHEWNEYDSIATRLAQKIASLQRQGPEFLQTIESSSRAVKGVVNALKTGKKPAEDMAKVAGNFIGNMYGMSVQPTKVDAALVYTNSPRRQYTFEFTLIDEGNPRIDIVDPINRLLQLSAPELKGDSQTLFENPYIFEVKTEPNAIININYAALIAVQPTYKGPWRNGFPSLCELQLQFIDLDPTYRSNFNKATPKVTVSSTLARHIPHYDKFKKYSSIADRLQDQVDAYGNKAGETGLVEGVRSTFKPDQGGSQSNWQEIASKWLTID